jgi:transposase
MLMTQQTISTKKRADHPQWATKFRTSGTELRLIRGKYYLYAYKTVYDPIKKCPKKISGTILGRINQEQGFIESPKNSLRKQANQQLQQTSTHNQHLKIGPSRECGLSQFILNQCKPFTEQLAKSFEHTWKQVMLLVYCRLLYQAPIKNMPHFIEQAWLKEAWQIDNLSPKNITALLKDIGQNRQQAVDYMKAFMGHEQYFLADTTHIPTKSNNIDLAKKGYNSKQQYDPQVHILYLYGASSKMPAFYRLHPGNIREVKAFKLTMIESQVKDSIIIGDKGFYSRANTEMLTEEGLFYIIPLKRNSDLINYGTIKANTFKKGSNFFKHEKRFIWHQEHVLESRQKVVIFLDESLRLNEEESYLTSMETHPEEYTQEGYLSKRDSFGTLVVISNLPDKAPHELYIAYKSRMAIETMFDSMKNILEADRTYMQDEDSLQGWMFINHIALQCYQKIYLLLKEHNMNREYSVKDFLLFLKEVKQVKINGEWHQMELTTATEKLLKKLQKTNT